jgi:hypothetical protein
LTAATLCPALDDPTHEMRPAVLGRGGLGPNAVASIGATNATHAEWADTKTIALISGAHCLFESQNVCYIVVARPIDPGRQGSLDCEDTGLLRILIVKI